MLKYFIYCDKKLFFVYFVRFLIVVFLFFKKKVKIIVFIFELMVI